MQVALHSGGTRPERHRLMYTQVIIYFDKCVLICTLLWPFCTAAVFIICARYSNNANRTTLNKNAEQPATSFRFLMNLAVIYDHNFLSFVFCTLFSSYLFSCTSLCPTYEHDYIYFANDFTFFFSQNLFNFSSRFSLRSSDQILLVQVVDLSANR